MSTAEMSGQITIYYFLNLGRQ